MKQFLILLFGWPFIIAGFLMTLTFRMADVGANFAESLCQRKKNG